MSKSPLPAKIREFLGKKGLDCTYTKVRNEFFRTYKVTLPQSSFHTMRNTMRAEAASLPVPAKIAAKVTPAPKKQSEIVEMIRIAKRLIDVLGKDEAKEVINSL